ncbi:MAG: hypothetical protein IJC49_02555 [Clostridia bacterium]|nr:hypothetical protein [Clostridia bacterium]
MNGIYAFLGVSLCLACLGAVLRQLKPTVFPFYTVGCVVICGAYLLSLLAPLISYVKELTESTAIPSFFALLFKAVGVSLLCSVASEICSACGETSLAKGVESAGKAVILILSLPVVKYLLESALQLAV